MTQDKSFSAKVLSLIFSGLVIASCNENGADFRSGDLLEDFQADSLADLGEPKTKAIPQDGIETESILVDEEQEQMIPESPELTLLSTKFQFGNPDPKVDYLFVIDNSVSMKPLLTMVNQGFDMVLNEGVFSPDSQIAVMTTMHSEELDFADPGIGIREYNGIRIEPGFLDFVNKSAIDQFKVETTKYAQHYPKEGCSQKWFKPDDLNADGDTCLEAAIQIAQSPLGAEAGIHAVEQLLMKNAGQAIFREDAIVNVIFVSDTHDPGINNTQLKESIASYTELNTLARVDNKINALKFHAVAPEESCTGEGLYEMSYFGLVQASSGAKSDICNTTDYRSFFQTMISKAQVYEPQFTIDKPADRIESVQVNGIEWDNYTYDSESQTVTILGLDPKVKVMVEVFYNFLEKNELAMKD